MNEKEKALEILNSYKHLFEECSLVQRGSIIPKDLMCSDSLSRLGSEMLEAIELLESPSAGNLEGQYERRGAIK
jgi:hypothetical protein